MEELHKIIGEVNRIKMFLSIKGDRDLTINDDDVKVRGYDTYKEGLGYIFNDDYLKIIFNYTHYLRRRI